MNYPNSEISEFYQNRLPAYPAYIQNAMNKLITLSSENQKIKMLEVLTYGILKSIGRYLAGKIKDSNQPFNSKNYQNILTKVDSEINDSVWFMFLGDIGQSASLILEDGIKDQINLLIKYNKGYEIGIAESIAEARKIPLSILIAAIFLRNAIHHDNTKKYFNQDLSQLSAYYHRIVVDILNTLTFIKSEQYKVYLGKNRVTLFQRTDDPLEIPKGWDYLYFGNEEDLKKAAMIISQSYPWFISEYIEKVFDTENTWELRIYWLKCLYYDATKFLALVGLSIYFGNDDITNKDLDKKLTKLGIPDDASWRNLIAEVAVAFEKKGQKLFIEEYIDQTKAAKEVIFNNIPDGSSGFTQNVLLGLKNNLNSLYAPSEIRNAIYHDENVPYETDFQRLFPVYAESVIQMLLSYRFLEGGRYKYVAHISGNNFLVLHGATKTHTQIEIPSFFCNDQLAAGEKGIFIWDERQDKFLSLFPFTLKRNESWEKERELILRRVYYKKVKISFSSRNRVYNEQPPYNIFYNLLLLKDIKISTYDLSGKNLAYLRDLTEKANMETLENYLGKKYQPGAYVQRTLIEQEVATFLEKEEKTGFFLTSNSGMGKSAFLANLVYINNTESTATSPIIIFLNAREILTRINDYPPVFYLLKRHLSLSDTIRNFQDFLSAIDKIREKDSSVKICLVIDAINESYHPQEIFDEIDELICRAYNEDQDKPIYPWFKVIFTFRLESIYLLKEKRKEIRDNFFGKVFFSSEKPYYQANTSESEQDDEKNSVLSRKAQTKIQHSAAQTNEI